MRASSDEGPEDPEETEARHVGAPAREVGGLHDGLPVFVARVQEI